MKVYFAGSIRGGRDDKDVYLEIIKKIQKHAAVLTEHIGSASLTSMGEHGTTEEFIYERDAEWVRESDIVIAEVSNPSLGVGYELAYAEARNIPVICLYRKSAEKKLSAMVRGNKYFKVIEYSQPDDLDDVLAETLKEK